MIGYSKTPVGEGVTLRWRPYQLRPDVPVAGVSRERLLRARHGEAADPARIPERLHAEAEEAGLDFNYAAMTRVPNTLRAHRLLEYAWMQGVQHLLAETLFDWHFCAGRDVGDTATLLSAAESVGLAVEPVRAYLAGQGGLAEVQADLERASTLGVSGVPCYLLAGRFTLPGAQTTEVMAAFIDRARTRLAATS